MQVSMAPLGCLPTDTDFFRFHFRGVYIVVNLYKQNLYLKKEA